MNKEYPKPLRLRNTQVNNLLGRRSRPYNISNISNIKLSLAFRYYP